MKRGVLVLSVGVGVVAIGVIGAEHEARRRAERHYEQAIEGRHRIESQYAEALTNHARLQQDLKGEQQRSHELSDALLSMRTRLEEAVGRLMEETRTVNELHTRLAVMQRRLDELQGELAVTLQEQPGSGSAAASGPVQLERIVIGDANAGALGRVVSVHPSWNFVVVDLGWDAVKIGDTITIFHNEELLAKARVDRVQEGISAATLLPEWEHAEIHVNDTVRTS